MSLYRKFTGSIDNKEGFSISSKVKEFFFYKKILIKEKIKNVTFENIITVIVVIITVSAILYVIFGIPLIFYYNDKNYQNKIDYGSKICNPNYYDKQDYIYKDGKTFVRFSCFKENGETYYILDK